MRSGAVLLGLAATTLATPFVPPAFAASILPIGFESMVRASGSVVVVRVADSRTIEVRTPGRPAPAPVGADAPRSAALEPGRVPFTVLTLVVEDTLHGSAPATLRLRMPGGTVGSRTLVIPGLPKFAEGQRYLLFLKPEPERHGSPVVGVNQGVFLLEPAPDGPALLTNEAGDYLVAVEDDRPVFRAGPSRAARRAPPPPDPIPGPGGGFPSGPSVTDADRRYWDSTEPGMTVADLAALVRGVVEGR